MSTISDPQTTKPRGKSLRRRVQVLVAVAAIAIGAAACSSSSGQAAPSAGTKSVSSSVHPHITISNFMFSPSSLTVKPGQQVTVTNSDGVAHTITADGGQFNTNDVPAHSSANFTAPKTPGTYRYRCSIHQFMTGTLSVQSK